MRFGQFFDVAQFSHQRFVNADPASRIENQHIKGLQFSGL